jgi:peptidoglycan/xylan/chitin deacetylase (PgdA/CDA1 family)
VEVPSFWPEPYQCAAVVTVNFDAESVERRAIPEGGLWGRYSYGRYGARVGVQRILAVLERYKIRATFFIPALDAESYPALMEQVAAAGHEVAGHGCAHEDFSRLSPDEQRAVLGRSEAIFERVFGRRPTGWRAPDGLMTRHTRRILIERGYRYDSSFCDDDLPYLVEDDKGRRLVELPVFAGASDRPYYERRRPPWVVASAWKQEFRAVYAEGGLFNLTIHPRGDYGSGRAVRIPALEAILEELRAFPRVWLATCAEVAEWVHRSAEGRPVWPA